MTRQDYNSVLKDLRAKRVALDTLIAAIETAIAAGAITDPPPDVQPVFTPEGELVLET